MFLYGPVCIPLITLTDCQRVVLWSVGPIQVAHTRFEIDQDCSWYISGVVTLVEEDVFSVAAFSRKVLEVAIFSNAVLLTELLPELAAN